MKATQVSRKKIPKSRKKSRTHDLPTELYAETTRALRSAKICFADTKWECKKSNDCINLIEIFS